MRRLLAKILIALFRATPSSWRKQLCCLSFEAAERNRQPAAGLRELMFLDERLYHHLNQAAIRYEGGIHPKHRLMNYHSFFVDRIEKGEKVLDVGCGNGTVAMHMAESGAFVTGLDLNEENISLSRKRYQHKNLEFIRGDATDDVSGGPYDVIVMSNVLEHIRDRVELLKKLQNSCTPRRFLIRIPMFNRHWLVPLKKELGMPYFSDSTHFTEYTLNSFKAEMKDAGLMVHHHESAWGEIWAEVLKCQ
ncbi:MAG: class I SAM-dependent methyltransferase [Desulfobacterales bacterium]|nr:class I SAM-dependent methyltransferase [Desulfobacterales bacterium]